MALTIIERDRCRQPQKFLLVLTVRADLDGVGIAADVVMVFLRSGGNGTRGLVRAVLATGCPEHDQVAALILLDTQDREVRRLDQVAVPKQFLLNPVELVRSQTYGRKDRLTVCVTILSDDDIAPAEILEIIGKRAQSLDDRVRVPTGLVLDALPFNRLLA